MPLKRNEILKPISREHHQGLLLCWKIDAGIRKDIEPKRIKKYSEWFFKNHLLPHFEIEERYLFPILGNDHVHIIKALDDHNILKKLFNSKEESYQNLLRIRETLSNHIRFEERVLFNEIQLIASPEKLEQIKIHHHENDFVDNLTDTFWEK